MKPSNVKIEELNTEALAERALREGPQCSETLFRLLRDYLYQTTGISLGDHKQCLLEARLTPRLRHHQFRSFRQYYDYLLDKDASGKELSEFVNALTTNKTEFFREKDHFDLLLKEWLPARMAARLAAKAPPEIRIWCAACSSGEEPYSIAMVMQDWLAANPTWKCKILATDIDSKTLEKAKAGVYAHDRLEGIPLPLQRKFVTFRSNRKRGREFELRSTLREQVTFRRLNLFDAQYPFSKDFDLVLCRNVLIYFDSTSRQKVIQNISHHLSPQGFLVIGHSENLLGLDHDLQLVGPTVYQKEAL